MLQAGEPQRQSLMGVTNMTLTGDARSSKIAALTPVTYGGFPAVGAGLTALACQRTGLL